MRVLEGKLVDNGTRVGIVAARFNEFIVSKLVAGAQDGLIRHGVSDDNIDLAWVLVHLKYHLLLLKWQRAENMMQ